MKLFESGVMGWPTHGRGKQVQSMRFPSRMSTAPLPATSNSQRFQNPRKEPRWGSTSGVPLRKDRSSIQEQLPKTHFTSRHEHMQRSQSSSRLERLPPRPKSARQVSNSNNSRRVMSRAASMAVLPRNM